MPVNITINDITGTTPYDVYLCDNPITVCVYVDTIPATSLPYTFTVPTILENQNDYTLKVTDNDGCVNTQVLTP